jgi:hypothetical protein
VSRVRDGLIVFVVIIVIVHFLWGAIAPLLAVALALLAIVLVLQAIL